MGNHSISYDYDVKYQPSTLHGNADGLSRLPLQEEPLEQDDSSLCFGRTPVAISPNTGIRH